MKVRTPEQWAGIQLGPEVSLVVGWRRGARGLHARRLETDRNIAESLRATAVSTLHGIGARLAREFAADGELEDDEFFTVEMSALPEPPPPPRRGQHPTPSAADDSTTDDARRVAELVDLLRTPSDREVIGDEVRKLSLLFYAVIFRDPGSDASVAFVKKANLARVMRPGRLIGVLAQTVTRLEAPVLLFDSDFDFVIDSDEFAIMNSSALGLVLRDVNLLAEAVPAYVATLPTASLPFTEAALEAIVRLGQRRRSTGKRLRLLPSQPYMATITIAEVRNAITDKGLDASAFIHDGKVNVDEDNVSTLLDVLAQRMYKGDFDHETWRADRASRVTPTA